MEMIFSLNNLLEKLNFAAMKNKKNNGFNSLIRNHQGGFHTQGGNIEMPKKY